MADVVVFLRSKRFFGGHIVTYPLLYALHKHLDGKRIRVVGNDPVSDHYLCLPWALEFVEVKGFWSHCAAVSRRTSVMMALHYTSEKYGLVAGVRRPKTRLGFTNKRVTDGVWTHNLKKNFDEYLAVSNLRLLSEYLPLDVASTSRTCFETIAQTSKHQPCITDVVMMPGGGAGHFKRWGLGNYLSLLAMLRKSLGATLSVTFLLGPDERAEFNALSIAGLPGVHLMMMCPIEDIAHVCIHARLIVANDCGPSHIAQGACVPYVGVYQMPNPQWYWARDYSRSVTPAPVDHGDIQKVSPAQVLAACLEVWRG